MEVLGLSDDLKQDFNHTEFQENIQRLEDGTYSSHLPWKPDHPPLPTNEAQTVAKLRITTYQLEKMSKLEEYHEIMRQQLEDSILEPVPTMPSGDNIHYAPHQPVIKDSAESTKLRIVYDCSAKEDKQPSLNDCREIGPSLQVQLPFFHLQDLLSDTYVDDVQSGGDNAEELKHFKDEATTIIRVVNRSRSPAVYRRLLYH